MKFKECTHIINHIPFVEFGYTFIASWPPSILRLYCSPCFRSSRLYISPSLSFRFYAGRDRKSPLHSSVYMPWRALGWAFSKRFGATDACRNLTHWLLGILNLMVR